MNDGYAAEQGDGGMDADLIPWLGRRWSVDIVHSEFPYFEYAGPEDSENIHEWMNLHGCTDIWTIPDRIRESSAYRTDVVGVRVDERALDRREREVGHLHPLTGAEGWGREQPYLRAFLNFRRDGMMSRDRYVNDHGLDGEPNGQDPQTSEDAVEWLTDHGFLTRFAGDLEAVNIDTLFGSVHAVELKREPSEWDTALEQASRASVYADYLWVCMSEGTARRAIRNADAFSERGVGLVTVSSPTGRVETHVQPEKQAVGERSHDLLSRPYCERWDLNERILKRHTGNS